jgi:6-phosphogluconolactonase
MKREIKIFPDIESLNHFAAEKFIEIGNETIQRQVIFFVALAGGSTPKSLYQLLASEPYKNRINWKNIFFFIGDERNVSENDAESNFRMINENLFEPLQIPEINIFRWRAGEKTAKQTAWKYEQKALSWVLIEDKEGRFTPAFNLILLGMGTDGHTASLFPYTTALSETKRLAVANPVKKLNTTRLTITFPVINNAENIIFLVAGEEKAETLRDVLEGEFQPEKLPSQSVQPQDGNLFWLADDKAASLLRHK